MVPSNENKTFCYEVYLLLQLANELHVARIEYLNWVHHFNDTSANDKEHGKIIENIFTYRGCQ